MLLNFCTFNRADVLRYPNISNAVTLAAIVKSIPCMKYLLIILFTFILTPSVAQNADTSKNTFIDTSFLTWFIENECRAFNFKYVQAEAVRMELIHDSSNYAYLEFPLNDSQLVKEYDIVCASFKFTPSVIRNLKILPSDSLWKIEKEVRLTDPDYDIKFLALSIPYVFPSKNLVWLLASFNLGSEQGYGCIYLFKKQEIGYRLIIKKKLWMG